MADLRWGMLHRTTELLAGAGIGSLIGLLIWYFTSERFWLLAGPIISAISFRWPGDRAPMAWANRPLVISDEVPAALQRAAAQLKDARHKMRVQTAFSLGLLELPTVVSYLEREGIEVAALRIIGLTLAVRSSSPTDDTARYESPAINVELQLALRGTVMRAITRRNVQRVVDFFVLLPDATRRHL